MSRLVPVLNRLVTEAEAELLAARREFVTLAREDLLVVDMTVPRTDSTI
jgi:hypothetical protein